MPTEFQLLQLVGSVLLQDVLQRRISLVVAGSVLADRLRAEIQLAQRHESAALCFADPDDETDEWLLVEVPQFHVQRSCVADQSFVEQVSFSRRFASTFDVNDWRVARVRHDGLSFLPAQQLAEPSNFPGQRSNTVGSFLRGEPAPALPQPADVESVLAVAFEQLVKPPKIIRAEVSFDGPLPDRLRPELGTRAVAVRPRRRQVLFITDVVLLIETENCSFMKFLLVSVGDDRIRSELHPGRREQHVIGHLLSRRVVLLKQAWRHRQRLAGIVESFARCRVDGK